MSDSEFWSSTPAKIFALLDYHSEVENPDKSKKKNENIPKMSISDFKQWGGTIRQSRLFYNMDGGK